MPRTYYLYLNTQITFFIPQHLSHIFYTQVTVPQYLNYLFCTLIIRSHFFTLVLMLFFFLYLDTQVTLSIPQYLSHIFHIFIPRLLFLYLHYFFCILIPRLHKLYLVHRSFFLFFFLFRSPFFVYQYLVHLLLIQVIFFSYLNTYVTFFISYFHSLYTQMIFFYIFLKILFTFILFL